MSRSLGNPKGYQSVTVSTVAIKLTMPDTPGYTLANYAVIRVSGAGVRYRDDGTVPTATVGMPLASGETLIYDGDLEALTFIRSASSDATLDVLCYNKAGD